MYLLDTDVIWALRRPVERPSEWARSVPLPQLFVSALTLGEIAGAAARLERHDRATAGALARWLDAQVVPAFEGRVLGVDAAVARRAATLGYTGMRDALLAATALEHGLTLATRDPAAFRAGKVRTIDPWRYTPGAPEEELDWREATRGGPAWLKNLFARG